MKKINQMEPSFDECERTAVNNYMQRGGWLTEFQETRNFEAVIAEYTGAKFCSVVSNGTVSLVIALLSAGVGPDDEVIVPDYTMAATATAAPLIGARTVFADIERQSLGLDFAAMVQAVTPKTKAVMLVSINGRYPRDLEKIIAFCHERGIHLIEDAAQSLGSRYKGQHLGTFGEVGSFSFSAPKIITTGQGGALVTDDPEFMSRIQKIRDFGRDKGGSDHYLTLGWNFKFTDLQAVIGLEQMKKLPARVEQKKAMSRLYNSLLADIPGVELLSTDYDQTSPWFIDALCENRAALQGFLRERGIGTREFYPALHLEPAFNQPCSCPVAEEISQKGLWLPSAVILSQEDIHRVCSAIREFYTGKTL